ncbi:hypothetical protein RQM59_01505 [Flavobacteriaceae bacterium S356]|uniref:Cardiolipin synthetase n=1 Tax=Asprobacillus argus TaxID=3076534 RepID=A0ABU3LBQ8_9FLAO|nr:hypothetical protein [Flavobacteriaceae bacterium S356]
MNYLKVFFLLICTSLLTLGCSSTQLVEQWKNPTVDTLYVSKILIVGMTPNLEARKEFEQLLKEEYTAKGIEAVMSLELFDPTFTTDKKSYAELKVIENILTANFFDAVLFTKVVGSKTQKTYSKTYRDKEYLDMPFQEDYYRHQEIYYNPKYYDEYKVYRAETSLYCICPTKDRELIWKGSIDIIDPSSIKKTVNDYVNLLILTLEQQQLFQ